jgi:hypothetical protein
MKKTFLDQRHGENIFWPIYSQIIKWSGRICIVRPTAKNRVRRALSSLREGCYIEYLSMINTTYRDNRDQNMDGWDCWN